MEFRRRISLKTDLKFSMTFLKPYRLTTHSCSNTFHRECKSTPKHHYTQFFPLPTPPHSLLLIFLASSNAGLASRHRLVTGSSARLIWRGALGRTDSGALSVVTRVSFLTFRKAPYCALGNESRFLSFVFFRKSSDFSSSSGTFYIEHRIRPA